MSSTKIKHFFSANLLITAFVMSAYSSAGVSDYQTLHKNRLFAVQSENVYLLVDETPRHKQSTKHLKGQSTHAVHQKSSTSTRKKVSWTDWFTNSHNSSFHFLNLLELIGV